jgi:Ribosome inactivating protein
LISFNSYTYDLDDNRWRDIPGNLINYPTSISSGLTLGSIQNALESASRWSRREIGEISHTTVAYLAFIISEAARFRVVEAAVDALLSSAFYSFSWNSFRGLLTNWQAISNGEFRRLAVPIPLQVSLMFAQAQHLDDLARINEDIARLGYPDPSENPNEPRRHEHDEL